MESAGLSAIDIVLAVLVMFIVLGAFLEGFGILGLTIPLMHPMLAILDSDAFLRLVDLAGTGDRSLSFQYDVWIG